jgi:sporulation protein YlmC with PRC-barrel domain
VSCSARTDLHHQENTMKLNTQSKILPRQVLVASMTAALSLFAAAPLRAAAPEPAKATAAKAPATNARQCLTDLNALQTRMNKDGYWGGGSGYGYGYPMRGYGYGAGMGTAGVAGTTAGYLRARPGFEVRTLLSAAQILGQHGQQAACAAVLVETRATYDRYATAMRSGNVPRDNPSSWRQDLLAAAKPVAEQDVAYRSDQLIGTEVLNPKGETLGSVDDMVFSPQTGKIAYLVIGRGGLFGINEKYVPVPWTDFKATAGARTLVLGTTTAVMSAAPQVNEDRFSAKGDFDKQSQQIDAYWSAHPAK